MLKDNISSVRNLKVLDSKFLTKKTKIQKKIEKNSKNILRVCLHF